MVDGRSPEGRRASAPLTACMAPVGQGVAKLASRLMADAMTLVRIAGALSVGDRAVFGRMERYLQNNKAGLGEIRGALTTLRAAAATHDPEFAAKNGAVRKVNRQRRMDREESDREALLLGRRVMQFGGEGFELATLGAALRGAMAMLAFTNKAPDAAGAAWNERYAGESAQEIVSEFCQLCIRGHIKYGLPAPDDDEPDGPPPVERDGNVLRPAFGPRSRPDLTA